MGVCTDEQIIRLFFDRDRHAVEEAERKYGKYLLTVACNILHNDQDAEECVNDTYLSTWNSIPPENPASLKRYLCRIVRNHAITKYRSQTAEKRSCEELCFNELDSFAAPEDGSGEDIRRILNEFLKSSSEKNAAVFIYRYYYAYPAEQIAERFGICPAAVYKILDKMKNRLKQKLNEEGITV